MAFDAGMVAAIVNELNNKIINAKIEKIHQPEKDEIIFTLRLERDTHKLLLSASVNNPRLNVTQTSYKNPDAPPMFCMLLRKHLLGARINSVVQIGFERVAEIAFSAYDELGYECKKYIYIEIMGKYSNIIFCDQNKKILNAIKIVDFTTSQKRQVLPGMMYELPPPQNKKSPLETGREEFINEYEKKSDSNAGEYYITNTYMGISQLVAREIIYRAGNNYDAVKLWSEFDKIISDVKEKKFIPTLIKDLNGNPIEYSYTPINQYGGGVHGGCVVTEVKASFGELIDDFYCIRAGLDKIKQRSSDIMKLLSNTEARLLKKIQLQKTDMIACKEKDKYKLYGDLIIANIYKIKKGLDSVSVINYYDDESNEVTIPLDNRLSPAQNAQKYYKKYSKAKVAETELAKQIKISETELEYIYTVFDALAKAENEQDLNEIRQELYESGYASKMKNYTTQKLKQSAPVSFMTESGYKILCGKNNIQNDNLSFKTADKSDYWFHVKNLPGSHVVLLCGGTEPSENDFTQAAMVAAYYSKAAEGKNVAVDYTLIKNLKKPAGSKPGYVIYHTNWTAYVTPDKTVIEKLKNLSIL